MSKSDQSKKMLLKSSTFGRPAFLTDLNEAFFTRMECELHMAFTAFKQAPQVVVHVKRDDNKPIKISWSVFQGVQAMLSRMSREFSTLTDEKAQQKVFSHALLSKVAHTATDLLPEDRAFGTKYCELGSLLLKAKAFEERVQQIDLTGSEYLLPLREFVVSQAQVFMLKAVSYFKKKGASAFSDKKAAEGYVVTWVRNRIMAEQINKRGVSEVTTPLTKTFFEGKNVNSGFSLKYAELPIVKEYPDGTFPGLEGLEHLIHRAGRLVGMKENHFIRGGVVNVTHPSAKDFLKMSFGIAGRCIYPRMSRLRKPDIVDPAYGRFKKFIEAVQCMKAGVVVPAISDNPERCFRCKDQSIETTLFPDFVEQARKHIKGTIARNEVEERQDATISAALRQLIAGQESQVTLTNKGWKLARGITDLGTIHLRIVGSEIPNDHRPSMGPGELAAAAAATAEVSTGTAPETSADITGTLPMSIRKVNGPIQKPTIRIPDAAETAAHQKILDSLKTSDKQKDNFLNPEVLLAAKSESKALRVLPESLWDGSSNLLCNAKAGQAFGRLFGTARIAATTITRAAGFYDSDSDSETSSNEG